MKANTVLALAVTIAAAVISSSLNAQSPVIHTVDFVEHSSTNLTASYDGVDFTGTGVVNTSADHWTVTLPVTASWLFNGTPYGWQEPPGLPTTTEENFIFSPDFSGNQLFVSSDQPGLAFIPSFLPNGSSVPIGIVPGGPINVFNLTASFTDLGDPVPDTGSTLGLLFLSLISLLGARRFRGFRLA